MKSPITKKYILKFFIYDKDKVTFTWKDHWCRNKKQFIGKKAGSLDVCGYRNLRLNGRAYAFHRLVYFLETNDWPQMIDHIDGDITNNHISNLKPATNRKNQQNQHKHRNGKLVGGTFLKDEGVWKAQILINKKKIYLGKYKTEIEAHQVYMRELKKHYAQGGI